jgi:hypothetical protein
LELGSNDVQWGVFILLSRKVVYSNARTSGPDARIHKRQKLGLPLDCSNGDANVHSQFFLTERSAVSASIKT